MTRHALEVGAGTTGKQTTQVDAEMQALIKAIETDRWTSPEVQDYKRLKDEFSVYNGVVLRMNRIFIPLTLRSRPVELAHLGHQGIVKTKQLIRDKVWLPGVEKLTEDKLKKLSLVPSRDSEITTNKTSSNDHTSHCTLERSCS